MEKLYKSKITTFYFNKEIIPLYILCSFIYNFCRFGPQVKSKY